MGHPEKWKCERSLHASVFLYWEQSIVSAQDKVADVIVLSTNMCNMCKNTNKSEIVCVVLETFINGCPGIDDCANSAVRSFWDSASAEVSAQQK